MWPEYHQGLPRQRLIRVLMELQNISHVFHVVYYGTDNYYAMENMFEINISSIIAPTLVLKTKIGLGTWRPRHVNFDQSKRGFLKSTFSAGNLYVSWAKNRLTSQHCGHVKKTVFWLLFKRICILRSLVGYGEILDRGWYNNNGSVRFAFRSNIVLNHERERRGWSTFAHPSIPPWAWLPSARERYHSLVVWTALEPRAAGRDLRAAKRDVIIRLQKICHILKTCITPNERVTNFIVQ